MNFIAIVSLILIGFNFLSKLTQVISLDGCNQARKEDKKQPKKCGEHIPFHGDRYAWKAAPGEFPFVADIEIKIKQDAGVEEGNFLKGNCSGAIVSKRFILTSIKCVQNKLGETIDKKNDLKVFIGSLFQNKYGDELGVEEILQLELSPIPPGFVSGDDYADSASEGVNHGLALLKLNQSIDFRFEHCPKPNKKERQKYINSACFVGSQYEPQRTLNSSQYVSVGAICLQAFEFEMTSCPRDDEALQTLKFGCVTLSKGPKELTSATYQEGAPFVEMLDDVDRWQLIGILSRDVGIFGDCEPPEMADTTLAKFISLYDEPVQRWLKREVLSLDL